MRMRRSFLHFAWIFSLVIFLFFSSSAGTGKKDRLNLLLISVDTLRADYLSCYGGKEVPTPHIDSLTKNGIMLEKAFAHVPLTLPSHVDILTGALPLSHGVHENLGFRLADNALTLAEHLKSYDYQTAAFIGAFPLDSRFGLSQGFDVYDDLYGDKKSPGPFFFVERKGEEVVSRAVDWLKSHKDSPWFVFVHLFDPHQPYIPPSPYAEKYADNLYAGEVAYTDECLGRLFRFLEDSNLMARTLIVFTADHGEALGDHGERTHGYFAYNSTIHIPLIFHSAALFQEDKKISTMVSHIDIFPTVCELLGLRVPASVQGQSLVPLFKGKKMSPRPVYFESLSAFYNRGWAPLRGFIREKEKFIDQPVPELYNLDEDFEEKNNLAKGREMKAYETELRTMMAKLTREKSSKARTRESRETLEKMKSLGYVGGQAAEKKTFTEKDDLKTLLPYHLRLMDATLFHHEHRPDLAVQALEELIKEKEDFSTAYEYLADTYKDMGEKNKAIEVLRRGLRYFPSHAQMRGKLGILLSETGQTDEAIKELHSALSLNEEDAELWNYLGASYWRSGDFDKAEECYHKAIALDEDYASAFNNLGSLYLSRQKPDQALVYLDKAISFDPTLASAYNGKAVALSLKGNLAEAVGFWKKAIEYEPDHRMALYNLGLALVQLKRGEEALPFLERYLKLAPADDPDREKVKKLINLLKNPG
jgi:arylsulfatase A-like enzyme/Flp pilus assembly protein TadD